ncbi:hypothetical protein AB0C96_19200 [Streptomyces sp. NPDC048506]|uniref:hypothetical protein n=1 Tax=Streptomyces sp. NPDC048506 TaxID=3155028 RepID=UPI00341CF98D
MHHVRRSAALTLLLLLAVAFGPLLCRTGGDHAWAATSAAPSAATGTATGTQDAENGRSTVGPASGDAEQAAPRLATAAPVAEAHAPKRCSDRNGPGPDESAPPPAPHRAEHLAPATTGPGPLAADLPAQHALARPPTRGGHHTDHPTLLSVLRM